VLMGEGAAWWWAVLDLTVDDNPLGFRLVFVVRDSEVVVCEHLIFMKRRRQKKVGEMQRLLAGGARI